MTTDATRAAENLSSAHIRQFTVYTAKAVTFGNPVKLSAAGYVEDATAITGNIGIAIEAGSAGDKVQVAMFGSDAQVRVLVGTGGATRGAAAQWVTGGGVTDVATGGGTTAVQVAGQFEETGVAGDIVALNLGMAGFSVTA